MAGGAATGQHVDDVRGGVFGRLSCLDMGCLGMDAGIGSGFGGIVDIGSRECI